jgi:hypothetical protein
LTKAFIIYFRLKGCVGRQNSKNNTTGSYTKTFGHPKNSPPETAHFIWILTRYCLRWEGVNGAVFCCQLIFWRLFYIEKQGMAMRLEEEGGLVAALFRNHPSFCRVTRQGGILDVSVKPFCAPRFSLTFAIIIRILRPMFLSPIMMLRWAILVIGTSGETCKDLCGV